MTKNLIYLIAGIIHFFGPGFLWVGVVGVMMSASMVAWAKRLD